MRLTYCCDHAPNGRVQMGSSRPTSHSVDTSHLLNDRPFCSICLLEAVEEEPLESQRPHFRRRSQHISQAAQQQIVSAVLGEFATVRRLVPIGIVADEVRRSLLRLTDVHHPGALARFWVALVTVLVHFEYDAVRSAIEEEVGPLPVAEPFQSGRDSVVAVRRELGHLRSEHVLDFALLRELHYSVFAALCTKAFFGQPPCQITALAWMLHEVGIVRKLVQLTARSGRLTIQRRFSAGLIGTAFLRVLYVSVTLVLRTTSHRPTRAAIRSALGAQLA